MWGEASAVKHTQDNNKQTTDLGGTKMTKIRKMMSIGLASCMAFSALMTGAGAADQVAEPDSNEPSALSANAGETLDCNLVVIGADGSATETFFDIDLPDDATNAEQQQMVMEKVDELQGQPATRAANSGQWYVLDEREDVYVPQNTGSTSMTTPNACSAYMDGNYERVRLYMTRIQPSIGNLNVRIECRPQGDNPSATFMNRTVTNKTCTVIAFSDQVSAGNVVSFRAGNTLSAYVSGQSGSGYIDVETSGYGTW